MEKVLTKICNKCGLEKPANAEHFTSNKNGQYGLRGQCKPCWRARVRELIKRPEVAANRKAYQEKMTASGESAKRSRKWALANSDKTKQAAARSRKKYKKEKAEYDKQWRLQNPDKISAIRKRTAEKLKQNPGYVLHRRVKARVRALLTGRSFGVVSEIVGYTKEELVEHIESLFTEGMNWEVLATGAVHLDHIRPVSSFDFKTQDCLGFKECWALKNLRPMWAIDNQRKGNRWESCE